MVSLKKNKRKKFTLEEPPVPGRGLLPEISIKKRKEKKRKMIFPGQDSPQPIEHAQIPRLALKPFHRLSPNQAPGYISYYSTKYKLQSREEQFSFSELLLHTHPELCNSGDKSSHLFFSFIPYNFPAREPFSFFFLIFRDEET